MNPPTRPPPPHSAAAEVAVLSCALRANDQIDEYAATLAPEDFYIAGNRDCFAAMLALASRREPVDVVTLRAELERGSRVLPSEAPFAALTSCDVPVAHGPRHAAIIRRAADRRAVLAAAEAVIGLVFDETTHEEFMSNVDATMVAATARGAVVSARPIHEHAMEWVRETQRAGTPGLTSGLRTIDKVTGGFRRGELTILAGRPGMGKSALAAALVDGVALATGLACVVFSLEMSAHQWVTRQVAARSGVNGTQLRDRTLNREEWDNAQRAVEHVSRLPLWLSDRPASTLMQVRAETRRIRARGQMALVAVDYLQLMSGGRQREPREQQVAEISRGLKALAKDCDVAVLALSQLNRKLEERGGKRRPQMSDLRESGALEQDADVIMFVDRNEKTDDYATVYVEKNRHGGCRDVRLDWDARLTRFADLDEHDARHWTEENDAAQ